MTIKDVALCCCWSFEVYFEGTFRRVPLCRCHADEQVVDVSSPAFSVEQNGLSVCGEGQANRFISFHSQVRCGAGRLGPQPLQHLGLFGAQSFHVMFLRVGVWTCFADVCWGRETADWPQLYCTDGCCSPTTPT